MPREESDLVYGISRILGVHYFELLARRSGCEGEAVTKAVAGEGGMTCPRYRPASHLSPPSGSSAKANVMLWLE